MISIQERILSPLRFGFLLALVASSILLLFSSNIVRAEGESPLRITEFMADPEKVTDSNGEWIEIKNTSDSDLDISGWDIDGSTITPNLSILANSAIVICRNQDIQLNGGVVCAGKSSYSLNNTSDVINLRNADNVVVTSVSYSVESVEEGNSTDNLDGALSIHRNYQYGLGDFGKPDNNEFGGILVHGVTETNNNYSPDLLGSEKLEAGHKVNLYKVNQDETWTLRNTTTTTDKNFPESAYFATTPGEYRVCLEIPEGFYETFAKQIDRFFTLSDNSTQNPKIGNDPICSKVSVENGKLSQQILGMKKKNTSKGTFNLHVLNDENKNGLPEFNQDEGLLGGMRIRLFSKEIWESSQTQESASAVTTGLTYSKSASIEVQGASDYWVLCLDKNDGVDQTFAREITSYVEFPDRSHENTKDAEAFYDKCVKTTIREGQTRSILFGVN